MAVQTLAPGRPVEAAPHHGIPTERRWILVILAVAQMMVVLDSTIVNIALPTAQHALGFSNSDRQWIVTAYALAFGSLLLVGGRLADRFGRRWALTVGLIGFATASAVGGAAVNFGMLAAARAVQGAFGALLAPAVLALLSTTFTEPKERSRAFGIFGGIAGAGASVGLLLGGVLTEYANWRWTLFVNLFLAAFALIGASVLLPGRDRAETDQGVDIPGTAAITIGLFALVFGFATAAQHGWSAPLTLTCLLIAAVLLVGFVLAERQVAHPVLPLRVVTDRNRGGTYLVMFLAGIGMFAVFLFLTYYLQQTLGYSAVRSGLAFLPMTGMLVLVAGVGSAVLVLRISARVLVPLGMTLVAGGLFLLTSIDLAGNYTSVVLPATVIMGGGLGLVFAPGFNLAISGVADEDAGVASATVNAVQQVGGSVGTALFNTLAASAASGYVASHLRDFAPADLAARAALHSYTAAFAIAAVVFLAGAVASAALLRSGIPQAEPAEVVMH